MTNDEFDETPVLSIPEEDSTPPPDDPKDIPLLIPDEVFQTEDPPAETAPPEATAPSKPKRTRRKKADKADADSAVGPSDTSIHTASQSDLQPAASSGSLSPRHRGSDIVTLEAGDEVQTQESQDDIIWHRIQNAFRTRRMLTGQLDGIEKTDAGGVLAVVHYHSFRVLIPLQEMLVFNDEAAITGTAEEIKNRQLRLLGSMLGSEIDFMVRGLDPDTRSVVASRRDAMYKKRQIFYFDRSANGTTQLYPGRIAQARVIAVAEKAVRVEIFGAECSIHARNLAWYWIGDAREFHAVGDAILVRVTGVAGENLEKLRVQADIRSLTRNTNLENLRKCQVQSRYAGKVTDVHKGVVFIRLANGVNAIAHSCFDYRMPGKKDDVSFVVTRLDEEQGVAMGIITRIIRQNL